MNLFDSIDSALSKRSSRAILNFGVFKIAKQLGKGGQARVYQLKHPIGKAFALKLYLPDPEPTVSRTENVQNFVREVKILATMHHKNIIAISTGGTATYDESNEQWHIVEGLNTPAKGAVYFYIMDYLSRKLSDIFLVCRKRFDATKDQPIDREFVTRRVDLFEKLVRHICDAIIYCHSDKRKLAHKDIKADNILFRNEDENFVLADFGFARHDTSPAQDPVIRRFETASALLLQEYKYQANDIFEFASVLNKILPLLRNDYDATRYLGIQRSIRVVIELNHGRRPMSDARAFKQSLDQYFTRSGWGLRLRTGDFLLPRERNRYVFDSKVQLPVSGAVPLTPEIRTIVDTAAFQRLRGTRQLGPTFFVFPGAYHTRFEHSIGTYHLALRYLESLTRLPLFNEFASPMPDMLKLVALSALLHDIGHYPYSHWIEELAPLPGLKLLSHEDRARGILTDRNSKMRKAIADRWRVDPDVVADVICGKDLGEDNKKLVAHSIIDSVLDVDKLDYLVRDSIHCGVTYGRGLDPDRLIDALYLDVERKRICLNRKGRSYLPSLLACRNVMYQEVYWHKTVRACTGMFKRFFYHYVQRGIDRSSVISRCLELSDDVFIVNLVQRIRKTGNTDLLPLIEPFAFKGRELFKPAFTFSSSSKTEEFDVIKFFQGVLGKENYSGSVRTSAKIAACLRNRCPGITPLDIIVEKTPTKPDKERYSFEGLRIWDSRRNSFEDVPQELAPLNQYLELNRQAYVFCHPKWYDTLKAITPGDWGQIMADAMEQPSRGTKRRRRPPGVRRKSARPAKAIRSRRSRRGG